jgi:hypothetical protein
MSAPEDRSEFERRTRETLEASVTRLDGRIRSRLTQARHAALDEARRRRGFGGRDGWRSWMPAGALAAAVLVAMLLWTGRSGTSLAPNGELAASFEDIELLADGEAFELAEGQDFEFYEWAVAVESGDGGAES